MKKFISFLLAGICCLFMAGCFKTKEYKVTFVQSGYEDIVKIVKEGESLTDIPEPQPAIEDGYEYVWNVTDFSKITEDMTITAIKQAKTITIKLILDNPQYTNSVQDIKIKYGEKFMLPKLDNTANYEFEKWQLVGDKTTFYEAMTEYSCQGTQNFEVIAIWSTWSNEH